MGYRSLTVQFLLLAVGLTVAVVVISLVVLWPRGDTPDVGSQFAQRAKTESARVVGVAEVRCRVPGQKDCVRVGIELRSGPDDGERASFVTGGVRNEVRLSVGDRILVTRNQLPEGAQLGGVRLDRYAFADFERRSALGWLAVGFVALVLLTGRWRGLRALAGLALSIVIVVEFVVPAILEGSSPVGVALVGALAIMLTTIPLAHGVGAKAIAAILGTTACLLLTAGLASFFTDLAHLTGFASEESVFIRAAAGELSIQGLLLAGMVIGALGVLDDLTVSQASTVMALRRANPALSFGRLVQEALDVGHDHIAATVNTLMLAYVGASLPIILIFTIGETPAADAVNLEAVAAPIVAMLVGSIGLIAAVPVTTVLAALLALRLPERALRDAHAAHSH
jgi:uncharacterized membrane protein